MDLAPERQISYVLTHKWLLGIKQRKKQPTIHNPRESGQERGPMDLIYMESRKRQDLMSKLGA